MLSMIFQCKKVNLMNILCITVFIAGAVLIGLSLKAPLAPESLQERVDDDEEGEEDSFHDAMFFAMACGLTLALNSLITGASWHELSVNQVTLDGFLVTSVILGICFFVRGATQFTWSSMGLSLACCILYLPSLYAMHHSKLHNK